jgi:hypothetical protein
VNPDDVELPPHRSIPIPILGPTVTPRVASGAASALESRLSIEYRRLMRWYPRQWRLVNEEAMLGTLLDQAEGEGRQEATAAERSAIAKGGIAQRFGLPVRGQRLRLLPLAAGFLLSVFYAAFIIWAPRSSYPGSLGPFANPSVVTCALLVLAFLAALVVRGRFASVIALIAALSEIVIGVLASAHPSLGSNPWEGPSPSTVLLFTGIAILGGASFRQGWMMTAATLIVLAAVATALVVTFVQASLGAFSPVSSLMTAGIAGAICVAVVIVIVGRRRSRLAKSHLSESN